jgi:hypothetical protein
MYEGGFGLTCSKTAPWYQAYLGVQTDPGMYQVTQSFVALLQQHGVDGLVYYEYIYAASPYGEWGSMQSLAEPSSLTPKYNALKDFANTVTTGSPTVSLGVSGVPWAVTAGTPEMLTVTARDASGKIATGYKGTVHFTSTDSQAGLPANYTFTEADGGVHKFTVTLKTAGSRSISASDTASRTITGSETRISVSPGAFSSLHFNAYPSSTTAGASHSFTVTARDTYTNTITNYRGTAHFTSTDPHAILPADYTFTSTDNGMHTFSAATLETTGYQYLKATDAAAGITGNTGARVIAAVAARLTVGGYPSPVTKGTANNFTVTLYDAYGNIATSYTGTVHFASSDLLAILPLDYLFAAVDAGKHTFTATLKTSGTQSIKAVDKLNAALAGTQGGITVN